jgi:uncharacterized protein (TIGR03435 family)
MLKRSILGLIAGCMAYGQTPDPAIIFEVASVKPAPPPEVSQGGARVVRRTGCSGGPGTPSPGQYTCFNTSVVNMVSNAFGLKPYQLPAASAADAARFDVTAKIPAGATKEQVGIMMQNLLIERFKLTYHYEKKEMQVYDLVVGKNGPKLKESPPEPPPPADGAAAPPPPLPAPGKMTLGPDGFPVLPARRGSTSMMMMSNGGRRITSTDAAVEQIVGLISNELARPVNDATGLKGKYDFTLTFTGEVPAGRAGASVAISGDGGAAPAAAPDSDAPSIFAAVQEQLGLKLEQKRGTVDLFIIDHVEKSPTEN